MSGIDYNKIECPKCSNIGLHSVTLFNIDTHTDQKGYGECNQCEYIIKVEGGE